MIATITITAVIAVALAWNIRNMVRNVRAGRSIDGCNGDCSHCSQCKH